jgi:hypothetical protein
MAPDHLISEVRASHLTGLSHISIQGTQDVLLSRVIGNAARLHRQRRDAEEARAVPTTFIVGHRRLPAARRPKKEQKVVQPTQKQRPHLKRNTKARLSQSDMALIALPT